MRKQVIGMLGLVLSFGAVSPAFSADCPLFKAVYAPVEPEDDMSAESGQQNIYRARHIRATPAPNQANYTFRIEEQKQHLSYDFSYAFPNGYGGTKLVFMGESKNNGKHKMKDSDPGSQIFYFDADMKSVLPDIDAKAPIYLIMPDIGSAFWYWTPGLRKFIPTSAVWKLLSCEP